MTQIKQNRLELIEDSLSKGINVTVIGSLLTRKKPNSILAFLSGIGIQASINAHKEAAIHNLTFLAIEEDFLIKIHPNGKTEKLSKINRTKIKIPRYFFIS